MTALLTRVDPGLSEVADTAAAAVKHEWAVEPTRLQPSGRHLRKLAAIDWKNAAAPVLAAFRS